MRDVESTKRKKAQHHRQWLLAAMERNDIARESFEICASKILLRNRKMLGAGARIKISWGLWMNNVDFEVLKSLQKLNFHKSQNF